MVPAFLIQNGESAILKLHDIVLELGRYRRSSHDVGDKVQGTVSEVIWQSVV